MSHDTKESKNSPESPHLGEIKCMHKQCLPGASLLFARAGDEANLEYTNVQSEVLDRWKKGERKKMGYDTWETKQCRKTRKKQVYQNLCIVSLFHKLFLKKSNWKWIHPDSLAYGGHTSHTHTHNTHTHKHTHTHTHTTHTHTHTTHTFTRTHTTHTYPHT